MDLNQLTAIKCRIRRRERNSIDSISKLHSQNSKNAKVEKLNLLMLDLRRRQSSTRVPLIRPIRYSCEEIESNKIGKYIVLPFPPNIDFVDFESIGRTTFKKYVLRLYKEYFGEDDNNLNIPFVFLHEATKPYIVHKNYQQSATDTDSRTMNFHDDDFNTMDYFAPPHSKHDFLLLYE